MSFRLNCALLVVTSALLLAGCSGKDKVKDDRTADASSDVKNAAVKCPVVTATKAATTLIISTEGFEQIQTAVQPLLVQVADHGGRVWLDAAGTDAPASRASVEKILDREKIGNALTLKVCEQQQERLLEANIKALDSIREALKRQPTKPKDDGQALKQAIDRAVRYLQESGVSGTPRTVIVVSEMSAPARGCPDEFTIPRVPPGAEHFGGDWKVCLKNGTWALKSQRIRTDGSIDLGPESPGVPWLPFPDGVRVVLVKTSPEPSPFDAQAGDRRFERSAEAIAHILKEPLQ